jgi:hypothetical protein
MTANNKPGTDLGRGRPRRARGLRVRTLDMALAMVGASLFIALTLLFYLQWQQHTLLAAVVQAREAAMQAHTAAEPLAQVRQNASDIFQLSVLKPAVFVLIK